MVAVTFRDECGNSIDDDMVQMVMMHGLVENGRGDYLG